ncbi:hypothetical protein E3N88_29273 [Mikania micrantha]|uniref:Uncharacterized protein n=1 Tax=Mikania micrantha TaxID=192012 RepID=A0A5N6MIK4_9ASTR|nr:hypothetical protein E3N88_29273 [Mikania micrantha]
MKSILRKPLCNGIRAQRERRNAYEGNFHVGTAYVVHTASGFGREKINFEEGFELQADEEIEFELLADEWRAIGTWKGRFSLLPKYDAFEADMSAEYLVKGTALGAWKQIRVVDFLFKNHMRGDENVF